MGQVKRVLGHVVIEEAGAKRKCSHKPKDHQITKGSKCLVVKDGNYGAKKNYCALCAIEILKNAEIDLERIRREIE